MTKITYNTKADKDYMREAKPVCDLCQAPAVRRSKGYGNLVTVFTCKKHTLKDIFN